jgi:hypothetical protein
MFTSAVHDRSGKLAGAVGGARARWTAPGTPFDPDRIAERDWTIVESTDSWQSEFRFEGA